jgi:hypothetical protein
MKKILCTLLFLAAAAPHLSASLIYDFNVDTSSLNGQNDYMDFALGSLDSSALGVTATISNFATDGSYDPGAIQFINGAGSLSGLVTVNNTDAFNDAYQGITLGNSLSFVLTLSGPGIDTPGAANTFGFLIYGSDQATPLLTNSFDGTIAGVEASAAVGVRSFVNPNADGGASAATVALATPEPSSMLLLSAAGALSLMWAWGRMRSCARL